MAWRDISDNPNHPDVLRARQAILSRAARAPITDRHAHIVELCRGRNVVDIGCVDHRASVQGRADWLHGQIAAVAARCLGVDIEPDGVAAMVANGFPAMVHDICDDPAPLLAVGPFDVVVAGEVIEHLAAPQALFEFAAAVLAPGGILIITTPNPYYPKRVWSGWRGNAWENADHVMYAFPGGIVELGERTGLTLIEYRTVLIGRIGRQLKRQALRFVSRGKRRLVGPHQPVTSPGIEAPDVLAFRGPGDLIAALLASRSRFRGMRSVYVLERDAASST